MQHREFVVLWLIMMFFCMITYSGAGHLVHKYVNGPVIQTGPPGAWDSEDVSSPKVLFVNGTYRMWYTGTNGAGRMAIGYATSEDGLTWNKYAGNPVLQPGDGTAWDSRWVAAAEVLFHGGTYHMWYNGEKELPMMEGSICAIGHATSWDGITWHKAQDNPCLKGVFAGGNQANQLAYPPTVIRDQNGYVMWYTSVYKGDIGIAQVFSQNCTDWNDVLDKPALLTEADETFIGAPVVLRNGSAYEMYLTVRGNGESRIEHASSPNGFDWIRDKDEVICGGECFKRTESRVANTSVIRQNGVHKFWYTANVDGDWQISYAEDFEAIPHVEKLDCSVNFIPTGESTEGQSVNFQAVVHNPGNEEYEATGCVKRTDGSIISTFPLSLKSNNIWSGKWDLPDTERNYILNVTTQCKQNGARNCSEDWIPKRFTTIGPVHATDDYYMDSKKPNHLSVRLKLHNFATKATAEKVTARLTPLVGSMVNNIEGVQAFGDIAPGQSVESQTLTIIDINPMYQEKVSRVPLTVHVEYDGFEMMSFDIILSPSALERNEQIVAHQFELTQNYPNPFNPATTIKFSLPSAQDVVLNIYNNLGEHVATLVNEPLSYGSYSYVWHAGNLPSGIYYYQLLAGPYSQVKKMLLVK